MSSTAVAIEIIDRLETDGIKRQTAKELIDFVESQQGDLATKEDIKNMATKQDIKDMATKQDLRAEIEPLRQKQEWLKWIVGIGFGALLTVTIYLHSDTKAEMNRRFTEMNDRFAEMDRRFAEMRGEMKELKVEIREIKELLQRGER